jgi:hypothetical protein
MKAEKVRLFAISLVRLFASARWVPCQIPFWDAGAALRVPNICNVTKDGLHVQMWYPLLSWVSGAVKRAQ